MVRLAQRAFGRPRLGLPVLMLTETHLFASILFIASTAVVIIAFFTGRLAQKNTEENRELLERMLHDLQDLEHRNRRVEGKLDRVLDEVGVENRMHNSDRERKGIEAA